MSDTKEQEKPANLYDEYDTSEDLAENGAWVDFRGGVKVKVRSESSKTVRRAAMKLAKEHRKQIIANNGVLPPELHDQQEILLLAKATVVDWQNVPDRQGNILPFNYKNAVQIFTDVPTFRRDVAMSSRLDETFKPEEVEPMVGNSPPPSKLTSPSVAAE